MMDARSEAFFAKMEPDLVSVLRASAQEPPPWTVVYGIRTVAAEAQCVATGHSTTMHSRHIADCNGLSAAAATKLVILSMTGTDALKGATGGTLDIVPISG